MRKGRRVISILLCFMMIAAVLTGCSGKKEVKKQELLDPNNPTTVTVWNYYNGDQMTAFEKLVNEFNNTIGNEKGIVVVSVSQGSINNLASALLDSAEGKVGAADIPSMASVYAETAYILNQKDAIVPMDSYFTQDELNEYIPQFIDEGKMTENGSLYMFPVSKSTEAVVINDTDWKEFAAATGVTEESIETYEDLTAAAEKYYNWTDAQTPDIPEDGRALYGRDSVSNYIYIGTKQLGHEMFQVGEDGKVNVDLDKATFRKLWDNYYIPYINGYFGSYANYRSEDIKTGAIIAMTCSTSAVTYIPTKVINANDESHDIDINIQKSLYFKNAASKTAVQQGAGYCIMKTSEAEEYASAEFLKWFTDTEQNLDFSVSSGYSPVKTASNDAEKIKSVLTTDSVKKTNLLSALLISSEAYLSGDTYTCRAFNGSKDVRDVLSNALEKTAVNDRASVVQKISEGAARQEAVAGFTSDAYFEQWFEDLCAQVKKTVS